MSPKPKPGHAKRRSTSPITATYLYNEPVAPAATATTPQVSFDASVFATVTGAAPLADSPAAAPVMRPPPTAAARLPAAAATAPDRASKLSHLSAEAAAAEKARLIKEQVYASFIKGGVPCGKQPSRGVGHFALQHAPPAPRSSSGWPPAKIKLRVASSQDQAQDGLEPRPQPRPVRRDVLAGRPTAALSCRWHES
jgi:hypothetical protein